VALRPVDSTDLFGGKSAIELQRQPD